MARLRIDGVQSFLFSAAVMLGACSGSSSSGNQGGQGGGGHGGSSTPAGTGGIAGGNGLDGGAPSGLGGSTATGGTSGGDAAPVSTGGGVALTIGAPYADAFNYTQGSYLQGFEFTANSPISVTDLGAYDSNYASLANGTQTFAPVPVGLYDITTHTLLGSVTVKASDPVTGVFHYASLATPIALNTTDTYAIVWVSGTNHYISGGASNTFLSLGDVNPAITYVAFAGGSSTLVEPNFFYSLATNGIRALNYDIGPNFKFVPGQGGVTPSQDASTSQDAGVPDSASSGSDGAVCVLGDGGFGTLCNGVCVDTQVDPMNCGGCGANDAGVSCEAGAACVLGHCQDVVGSLQGLRWNLPCASALGTQACYASNPTPQSSTVQGTAGVTYAVTLRLRGVVEQETYNGKADGGVVATGTNASFFVEGATPAGEGYNVYSLTISAPAQTAYLNSGTANIAQCWPIDYTVTLPMQSGARITLAADTVNGSEIINRDANGSPIVVPGISPAPTAYNGQFIQMDVIDVVPMP